MVGNVPALVSAAPMSAASIGSDVQGHWAEKALTEWLGKGWISGYGDGTVRPNQPVTRAELAAMINKAFGLQGSGKQAEFSDLPAGHWARNAISTALEQGYMKGTGDNEVSPNRPAARQEAAVMLAALVRGEPGAESVSADTKTETDATSPKTEAGVTAEATAAAGTTGAAGAAGAGTATTADAASSEGASSTSTAKAAGAAPILEPPAFKDAEQLASWSREAVALLVSKGIMKGDPAGNFRPLASLTRAEAVVAIGNALAVRQDSGNAVALWTIDQPGVYGGTAAANKVSGDIAIRAAGVTLQHVQVTGKLLIGPEVGEGDVTLKGVTVSGVTTIEGGGVNSVHVQDSTLGTVVVNKAGSAVRVVAAGTTRVEEMRVQSPARIEGLETATGGIRSIEVAPQFPAGGELELSRHAGKLRIRAAGVQLSARGATIGQMIVDAEAKDGTFKLDKGSRIESLELNAKSSFSGDGKIDKAKLSKAAENATFAVKPGRVERESGLGGGGFGGGGGGGGGAPGNGTGSGTETRSALLSSLAVEGYTLHRLSDQWGPIVGTGFSSEVQKYKLRVKESDRSKKLKLSFAPAESGATAKVTIFRPLEEEQRFSGAAAYSMDIQLVPNEDVQVDVVVQTGTVTKKYQVWVHNTDMQHGTSIKTFPDVSVDDGSIRGEYQSLRTSVVDAGDELRVTYAGRELYVCKDENYSLLYCDMSIYQKQVLPAEKLQLEFQLTKYNGEIERYTYDYNGTKLPYIESTTDLSARQLTKDELEQITLEYGEQAGAFHYGYKLGWSTQALKDVPPGAAYYDVIERTAYGTAPAVYGMRAEDAKGKGFTLRPIGQDYYQPYSLPEEGSRLIYDQQLYIVFYDEQGNPLAYTVQLVPYDQEHVLAGIALGNTKPGSDYKDYLDASLSQLAIDGVSFYNEVGWTQEFHPNHYLYVLLQEEADQLLGATVRVAARSPHAKLRYQVHYEGQTLPEEWQQVTGNTITLPQNREIVSLTVVSQVDIYTASYTIMVEGTSGYWSGMLNVNYYPHEGQNKMTYLFSYMFDYQDGDVRRIYKNKEDTEAVMQCVGYCTLPEEMLNVGGKGKFYHTLVRSGQEGEKKRFTYDLTRIAPLNITKELPVKRLTVAELEQRGLPGGFTFYGWEFEWNLSILEPALAGRAAYYSSTIIPIYIEGAPPSTLVRQAAGVTKPILNGMLSDSMLVWAMGSRTYDQYIYVTLYDHTGEPIGCIIQRQNYDPAFAYYKEAPQPGGGNPGGEPFPGPGGPVMR